MSESQGLSFPAVPIKLTLDTTVRLRRGGPPHSRVNTLVEAPTSYPFLDLPFPPYTLCNVPPLYVQNRNVVDVFTLPVLLLRVLDIHYGEFKRSLLAGDLGDE